MQEVYLFFDCKHVTKNHDVISVGHFGGANMASNVSSQGNPIEFSEYYDSMVEPVKDRYREKVQNIGFDPYSLKNGDFSEYCAKIPSIVYPDIVNYLVLQTSWATNKQMRAYKSMDAYNFFVSGWVGTLLMKEVHPNKTLVFARVNHSQRARETPLKTWFFTENDGTVITAHCNCMAGLSEACSHIGALLFACEAGSRIEGLKTCTGNKNKWLMPSHVKEIPYLPASEMDLRSAKQKHKMLLGEGKTPSVSRDLPAGNANGIQNRTTLEEQNSFFENISCCGTRPAILSLMEPFSDLYVPKQVNLPKPITERFDKEPDLDFTRLLEKCSNIEFQITQEECKAVESNTRGQASSSLWFRQRAGRITASELKSVYCSRATKPPASLVKSICYPESHKFSNVATNWGKTKEAVARSAYQNEMEIVHDNFTVSDSGLHINPEWPFLGASPDGLVCCDCCGSGACEIKCPYKDIDLEPWEAAEEKGFCLKRDGNKILLDKSHGYYYQVQAQLFICDIEYCDFVVWTPRGIYIERILPDLELWRGVLIKSEDFFYKAILPEVIGQWFTRSSLPFVEQPVASDDDDAYWCLCQQHIEGSTLVRCENTDCKIKWYHLKCLRMSKEPEGYWLCPDCNKSQK